MDSRSHPPVLVVSVWTHSYKGETSLNLWGHKFSRGGKATKQPQLHPQLFAFLNFLQQSIDMDTHIYIYYIYIYIDIV